MKQLEERTNIRMERRRDLPVSGYGTGIILERGSQEDSTSIKTEAETNAKKRGTEDLSGFGGKRP